MTAAPPDLYFNCMVNVSGVETSAYICCDHRSEKSQEGLYTVHWLTFPRAVLRAQERGAQEGAVLMELREVQLFLRPFPLILPLTFFLSP